MKSYLLSFCVLTFDRCYHYRKTLSCDMLLCGRHGYFCNVSECDITEPQSCSQLNIWCQADIILLLCVQRIIVLYEAKINSQSGIIISFLQCVACVRLRSHPTEVQRCTDFRRIKP